MRTTSGSLAKAENELVELYERLKASDKWDQPFLAGQGKHYCCSTPKVLFVGKATGRWSNVKDTNNRKKIREASDQLLDAGGLSSPFWNYMRRLGQQISPDCGEQPLRHIAWTNIARLGYKGGNPEGDNFTQQKAICKKLLEAEISTLKPDLIILLTNNYQWRFVKEFFSSISWQCLPDPHEYAWYGIWRNQTAVVWTRHPQGKPQTELESEQRAIIDLFRCSVANKGP